MCCTYYTIVSGNQLLRMTYKLFYRLASEGDKRGRETKLS